MKTIWSGAIKYENALTKNQSTFWPLSGNTISEKKTASNLKFSCLAAKVSEAKMVFEEDCKNENLFLCSVPLSCVQEFCPEVKILKINDLDTVLILTDECRNLLRALLLLFVLVEASRIKYNSHMQKFKFCLLDYAPDCGHQF